MIPQFSEPEIDTTRWIRNMAKDQIFARFYGMLLKGEMEF